MKKMMKHSKEPWSYEVIDEYDENSCDVFDGNDHSIIDGSNGLITEANARRIVACVNACAGIATDHLEKYGLPAFAEKISLLVEQRDELLAALEQFATWGRMQHKTQSKGGHATFDMMSLKDEIDLAELTIASVKGEASEYPFPAEMIAAKHLRCHGLKPPCKFDCPCWFESQEGKSSAKGGASVNKPLTHETSAHHGWSRITSPGQVKVGHKLRFTIGDVAYSATAREILFPGTDREEIIYNKRRNYYLITSMCMANTGSQKNVEFFNRDEGGAA